MILTNILQICNGNSAAGTMRHAGYNFILMFNHGFDGPMQDFQSYEEYEKRSASFLDSVIDSSWGFPDDFKHMFFVTDRNKNSPFYSATNFQVPILGEDVIQILRDQKEIHFWLTPNFSEHILLSLIIRLFDFYAIDPQKIKIKWVPVCKDWQGNSSPPRGIGIVSHIEMHNHQNSFPLSNQQMAYFRKVWTAITSPTPDKWVELTHYPNEFSFIEGLKQFLGRFPCSQNGLNFIQRKLLNGCTQKNNPVWAINIIVPIMELNNVSEFYVYWWLKGLSNSTANPPACTIETHPEKADLSLIGRQYVTLTDYGRALLEDKANWLEDRDVDYYVGGIHVTSSSKYFCDEISKQCSL